MNRTQELAVETCGYALANRYFTTWEDNDFDLIPDFEDMEIAERGIKALGLDADEVTEDYINDELNGTDGFHRWLLDDDFTLADLVGTEN